MTWFSSPPAAGEGRTTVSGSARFVAHDQSLSNCASERRLLCGHASPLSSPNDDAWATTPDAKVEKGRWQGELLRRYWQPVCPSEELSDLPKKVKILCEELIVFRDKKGRVGALEPHCSHRGTSLEYGRIEGEGILTSVSACRPSSIDCEGTSEASHHSRCRGQPTNGIHRWSRCPCASCRGGRHAVVRSDSRCAPRYSWGKKPSAALISREPCGIRHREFPWR